MLKKRKKKMDNIKAGKDVEQVEFAYTAGENKKWYRYFGKQCGNIL